MFRLSRLYAVFIAASLIFFPVLYWHGRIPYTAINIFLIVIAPAGYVYSAAVTRAMLITAWLVGLPMLIFILKIDPVSALAPTALFSLLVLSYLWCKNIVRRERALRHEALNKNDDGKLSLSEDRDRAARFENGIKIKEAEIVNLYEITKKMSEHLKFEDIFGVFSLFLKENFTFRRCDLLVLDRVNDSPRIHRVYSVWYDSRNEDDSVKAVKGDKIIELFTGGFREVWLTKKDNADSLKDLGVDDNAVETFVALPLLSERKMVGALAVENLQKADLERFIILAMQFALEIKKVLLYETIEKLAVTDSLTGLYVRRYFYERLDEELQRSERYKFELAFIMADIDDFKKCNDTYGHMVGDVAIRDIARIIKEGVREIDIVGRYGGEEFAIVLPETGIESALQVAERLRKKVEDSVIKAYDEKVKLTISVGVAIYPKDASEISDVIDKADRALYQAKDSGKNVVCEYKR